MPPAPENSNSTVAIVGRPNVGKSTLFNRLTGKRTALVSDMPGLTRDRREGEFEIGQQTVQLIDTAGLEDSSKGSIAARMRSQTERAIQDADVVLFVFDCRDGVTPADLEFARLVRSSGRPTILVANKCEGRAGQDGAMEAFELALGEPIPVSAEHGEGIGDLITDTAAALGLDGKPSQSDDAADCAAQGDAKRPIRIAIVGRPNSGKSTLVNALVGEERMITGPEPGLTRDSISIDVTIDGVGLRLFDTAGLRRKARISDKAEQLSAGDAIRAIRFAEVVVLVIDAERPLEHQELAIADLVTKEGRALVLAVNKWDLIADKQPRLKDLKGLTRESLAQVPDIALVPISALAERGLDKLVTAILRTYEVWNRRVPTADLNRWLHEALARHAPPAVRGRRIKIRFMTQPSARPPTFVAFCSLPTGLPRSYIRYLTNSLRHAFNLPGVPIRLNLRKGDNPFATSRRRG